MTPHGESPDLVRGERRERRRVSDVVMAKLREYKERGGVESDEEIILELLNMFDGSTLGGG